MKSIVLFIFVLLYLCLINAKSVDITKREQDISDDDINEFFDGMINLINNAVEHPEEFSGETTTDSEQQMTNDVFNEEPTDDSERTDEIEPLFEDVTDPGDVDELFDEAITTTESPDDYTTSSSETESPTDISTTPIETPTPVPNVEEVANKIVGKVCPPESQERWCKAPSFRPFVVRIIWIFYTWDLPFFIIVIRRVIFSCGIFIPGLGFTIRRVVVLCFYYRYPYMVYLVKRIILYFSCCRRPFYISYIRGLLIRCHRYYHYCRRPPFLFSYVGNIFYSYTWWWWRRPIFDIFIDFVVVLRPYFYYYIF